MALEWDLSGDDEFSHAFRRAHAAHWQAVRRLQFENDQLRAAVMHPRTPRCIEGDDLQMQSGAKTIGHQDVWDPCSPRKLLVEPAHWSSRGASSPRSPRMSTRRDPLQVLASGGEGDGPHSMDCRAQLSFSSDASDNESSRAIGERASTKDPSHDVYQLRDQWRKNYSAAGSEARPDYSGILAMKSLSSVYSNKSPQISLQRSQRGMVRTLSMRIVNLRCIDPESNKRIFWDMCSVALLVYDCVMLPLSFFKFRFGSWARSASFACTTFWTVDILASFCTGFYQNGLLQDLPKLVAYHYVKTWFCFDALVTVLEWILIFLNVDDSDGASSISGIRIVRFIRFARILRAVKLSVLASKLSRRVNNVTILLVLRLLCYMSALVMINHATAALWYIVGESGNNSDGWMASNSFESRSQAYHYLSSLHWSLCNFHGTMEVNPGNERERAFACVVLLLGIVGFSYFIGSITNSISMVQNFHEVRTRKHHLLCKYLIQHNISGSLSAKAKRCFEEQMLLRQQEEEIDIANVLSGNILDELHEEARTHHAMSNSLFCVFCSDFPRVVRQLCTDAMAEQHAKHSHNFFFHGDACERVTIIMKGIARYIHHSVENDAKRSMKAEDLNFMSLTREFGETVHDSRWICEMVLWTHWVCCGWLGTTSDCQVLTIDQKAFGRVVQQYEHAFSVACDYAHRVVDKLRIEIPSDLLEVSPDLSLPNYRQRSSAKRLSLRRLFSS